MSFGPNLSSVVSLVNARFLIDFLESSVSSKSLSNSNFDVLFFSLVENNERKIIWVEPANVVSAFLISFFPFTSVSLV